MAQSWWLIAPLLTLLAVCTADELRTRLIRDVWTLPSLLYFVIVRFAIDPTLGVNSLLSATGMLLFGTLAGVVVPRRIGRSELIGMGAIKLLASVAAAIGYRAAMIMVGSFVAMGAITILVKRCRTRPSSSSGYPIGHESMTHGDQQSEDRDGAIASSPLVFVSAAFALLVDGELG